MNRDNKWQQRWWKFAGLLLTAIFLVACSSQDNSQTQPQTTTTQTAQLKGIITKVNAETSQVTLRSLEGEEETVLNFNSLSKIYNSYKQEITGEDLSLGSIVATTYDVSNYRLLTLKTPSDVWEYDEVDWFTVSSENNMMQFAGGKYQYSDTTSILAGEQKLTMMEINRKDILNIWGIGYKVYSIVRTSGHGYVKLSNYSDFIGGYVEIGTDVFLPVTSNMLVTLRQGTYPVVMWKNGITATKTAVVQADQETDLDFSKFKIAKKKIGKITFHIKPAGALLTINNTQVDYTSSLSLPYGIYQVGVTLSGYSDYSGTLDVEEGSSTVTIDLTQQEVSVSTATPSSQATATPSSTSSSDNTTTKKMDSDHTITISAPEGAAVYLDNVYKGVAPCSFTKILGSQTITLSKTGSVTKSYSVDILDDSQNVKLSFPDLVEDSD